MIPPYPSSSVVVILMFSFLKAIYFNSLFDVLVILKMEKLKS